MARRKAARPGLAHWYAVVAALFLGFLAGWSTRQDASASSCNGYMTQVQNATWAALQAEVATDEAICRRGCISSRNADDETCATGVRVATGRIVQHSTATEEALPRIASWISQCTRTTKATFTVCTNECERVKKKAVADGSAAYFWSMVHDHLHAGHPCAIRMVAANRDDGKNGLQRARRAWREGRASPPSEAWPACEWRCQPDAERDWT